MVCGTGVMMLLAPGSSAMLQEMGNRKGSWVPVLREVPVTCDFAEVPLPLPFAPGSATEDYVHPPACGHAQGLFGSQIPSSPGSRLDKKLQGDPTHRPSSKSASSADWIVGVAS